MKVRLVAVTFAEPFSPSWPSLPFRLLMPRSPGRTVAVLSGRPRLIQEDRPAEAIGHLQRVIEVQSDASEPYAAFASPPAARRSVGEVGVDAALIQLAHDHLSVTSSTRPERVLKSLFGNPLRQPEPHLLLQALYAKRARSDASNHAGKIFKGLLGAYSRRAMQDARNGIPGSGHQRGVPSRRIRLPVPDAGSSACISRRRAACTTSSR